MPEAAAIARPHSGDRLGEVIVLVGMVGPGRWRARQTSVGREVLVCLAPEGNEARWERERRLALRLLQADLPGLPALVDAGHHPALGPWLALLLPQGHSPGPELPWHEAVRAAMGLCRLQEAVIAQEEVALQLPGWALRLGRPGDGALRIGLATLPRAAAARNPAVPATWAPDDLDRHCAESDGTCRARAAVAEVARALCDLLGLDDGFERLPGATLSPQLDRGAVRACFTGGPGDIADRHDLEGVRRDLGRLLAGSGADRRSSPDERALVGRRYELLGRLGEGGMASVFRSLDRATGRVVAVKLHGAAGSPGDAESLSSRALQAEFRLLAGLDHPHVAEVLDFGVDPEVGPYLVMELYERGVDLRSAARGCSPVETVYLLCQLVRGVDYLHRQGVVHRDLKPANVLVDEGRVRILDLGVSTGCGVPELVPGRVVGSRGYIAPEVLVGQEVTPAADMYAVGIMAHELLVGWHPFPGRAGLSGRDAGGPGLHLEGLQPELAGLLSATLSRHPADRPSSEEALGVFTRQAGGGHRGEGLLPEALAPMESARFAGRASELMDLARAMEQALAGDGSAWLLEGPAGIGKSRLVEELCTRARIRGVSVVVGQTAEVEAALEPLAPLARRLALLGSPDDLALQVFASLDPDLPWRLGRSLPPPPSLPPAAAANRLADTLFHELYRVEEPLLIVLEDVHWASETLRSLLARVGRACPDLPLMVVATARLDDHGHSVLGAPFRPLRLGPLSSVAIGEIGVSVLGARGAREQVIAQLVASSEGNPFLAVETARELARGEDVDRVHAGGLEGILRRRLAFLEPEQREFLALAAVLGRTLDRSLLRRAFPDAPMDRWISRARQGALVEWRDGELRFVHERLRQALLDDLGTVRRAGLCRRASALIETQHRPGRASRLVALYDAAGDHRAAAAAAGIAGTEAAHLGAHAEAVALLTRACRECPDAPVAQRLRWWWLAGESHYALGEGEAGVACCERVLAEAGLRLPRHLPGRLWRVADDAWALGWARLVGPAPRAPLPGAVLSALGLMGAHAYNRDDGPGGLLVSIRALRLAYDAQAWGAVARFAAGLQLGLGSLGLGALAGWLGQLAAEAGPRAGGHPDRAAAMVASAFADVCAGRFRAATAQARAAEEAFDRTGHARGRDEARLAVAWAAHLAGELEGSDARYRSLVDTAAARGDRQMLTWALHGLALVRFEAGDFDGATHALDRRPCGDDLPDPAVAEATRAAVALVLGDLRGTWDHLARADGLLPRRTTRGVLVQAEGLVQAVAAELAARGCPELSHEQGLLERIRDHHSTVQRSTARAFPWVGAWRDRVHARLAGASVRARVAG